jgi:HEAT repeat protein
MVIEGGPVMSRLRRRLFGPLLYSTLVLALLAAVYAAYLHVEPMLERIADRRQVASLVEMLRAAEPATRESAANLLVMRGPGISLPILRDAARDPRGEVRALACQFLVKGGGDSSETVPVLIVAAGDEREDVRIEAARGLGRVPLYRAMLRGTRSTWGGLTPALRDDAFRTVRRLLKDRSSPVRAEAAGALAGFGPDPSRSADLTAAAADDDRAVRLAAAKALVKVNGPSDPAAARPLLALVASPDAVPDRPEVLQAVKTMSEAVQDRAVAALADLLLHGDPDILPDVLACLPEAGPRAKAAVPVLEALLDHADPGVRAATGMAIVAIESPEDLQALPDGTSGMGMGMSAGMAGPAPGGHANPRTVAVLARLVADATIPREMRENALGMIRVADAPALAKASSDLVRQLADPDPNVRRTALDLLSRIIEVAPADLPAVSASR